MANTSTVPAAYRADRACLPFPIIRAVLLTPDLRGKWGSVCEHGYRTTWPSRAAAQIALRTPEDWAPCCAACGEPDAHSVTPWLIVTFTTSRQVVNTGHGCIVVPLAVLSGLAAYVCG